MQEQGKETEYWNTFYRKWITIKTYVDIETGEIINEQQYKLEYKTINKEYAKAYGKNYGYHKRTYIGRRKSKQLGIW